MWNCKLLEYYSRNDFFFCFSMYYTLLNAGVLLHTLKLDLWTWYTPYIQQQWWTCELNFLSSRIAAVPTSASTDLQGFKAHTVFKEIEKKLQEVIQEWSCLSPIISCKYDSASVHWQWDLFMFLSLLRPKNRQEWTMPCGSFPGKNNIPGGCLNLKCFFFFLN